MSDTEQVILNYKIHKFHCQLYCDLEPHFGGNLGKELIDLSNQTVCLTFLVMLVIFLCYAAMRFKLELLFVRYTLLIILSIVLQWIIEIKNHMNNSLAIHFNKVTKRYTGLNAIDNLELEVFIGELFGFLGPNGAGKTTAMKLAAGLVKPSGGRVLIAGSDVQAEPDAAKRQTGFVPDNPYIYESLTGREFLHYCAGLYKLNSDETSLYIEELFERFNIGSWVDKRAGEYSHGMQQRVIMASAFLHKPRVILIDEPMVGLDPAGVRLVKIVLQDFCASGGTVFMSTHTLSNAEELCNRVGIVNNGKLIACGSLDEVRSDGKRLEDAFIRLTNPESTR